MTYVRFIGRVTGAALRRSMYGAWDTHTRLRLGVVHSLKTHHSGPGRALSQRSGSSHSDVRETQCDVCPVTRLVIWHLAPVIERREACVAPRLALRVAQQASAARWWLASTTRPCEGSPREMQGRGSSRSCCTSDSCQRSTWMLWTDVPSALEGEPREGGASVSLGADQVGFDADAGSAGAGGMAIAKDTRPRGEAAG